MTINEIKDYVKLKHDGQTRIQGTPYYLHPFSVCEIVRSKGYGLNYQIIALFHDLLEDTDAAKEELLSMSNNEVLEAVELLTKEDGFVMEDYVYRIRNNSIAKVVKLADRLHNLKELNMATKEFILYYIDETKKWYVDLAKGTEFEDELKIILTDLENQY